ncbi:MAG: hypothetical protein KKB82_06815 [Candidatus Omnitrophica bacterium]|nr:hypothetical protein [Candidatus Omnitrophota bacterium]MBU1925614.1 hypothetical protein [Candidatus Omnitrophota bacterium]
MFRQRKKVFFLGAGAGYLYNFISVSISLISIPMSLTYFGVERYGAFAIITTLLIYLSITNLGISTAAGILTAKALDKLEQLKIIAKAFVLVTLIAIVFFGILAFFTRYPFWIKIIGKIPAHIHDEVAKAAFFAAALFLFNLPFALFLQGFVAIQKVYIARLYDISAIIFSFLALIITVFSQRSIVYYFVLKGVFTLIISIISVIHFNFFEKDNLRTLKYSFNKLFQPASTYEFSTKSILVTGFRIFACGIAALVVWHTDNLVISNIIGLKAVTPYNITFRLIAGMFVIFTTLNMALNPMYGKAFAAKDYKWIENNYNRITAIEQILGGLVWIVAVAFTKDIINLLTGPSGYAGMLVVFALGGYGYSLSLVHAHSGLLSSINEIKNAVYIGWSEAAANLIFSLILIRFLGIGGVALGTFLAALSTVFWLIPREIYCRTHGKIRFNFLETKKYFFIIILPTLVCILFIHYFINSQIFRLTLSTIVIFLYLLFSYLRLTPENKHALRELYQKVRNRSLKTEVDVKVVFD